MAETKVQRQASRQFLLWGAAVAIVAVIGFAATGLLVNIFEHKQEAKQPFVRLAQVNEISTDPVPWGTNWPYEFDTYKRTIDVTHASRGASSSMPESKLEEHPWLKRLYAGYAFSIDYRQSRGHAYMLYDQEVTERVTKRKQTGACLHCHASIIPTYRRLGMQASGQSISDESLASSFNWPAVLEGFKIASAMDYATAHNELFKTPDGTPGESPALFPGGAYMNVENGSDHSSTGASANTTHQEQHKGSETHPVGCIDCHDPETMHIRVTRPGFIKGIAALAQSEDKVPHLPSIERWRKGDRSRPYDPMTEASRQEMRIFVCAQCHVEYYCASKETLFFPWDKGLKVEQIEAAYDNHKFPDGTRFYDFVHGETGAHVYKAQHPEFEMFSQGVHARSGVSCADCHMPYERQGAMKVSTHWVRSPLDNINHACQTCHHVPEEELRDKVATIQHRTELMIERAAVAMTEMLDSILEAKAAGSTPEQLALIFELQRKAMWRLDFVSSENSMGFHADQESMRILGESIDYSRQAQSRAIKLHATVANQVDIPREPILGVTPKTLPKQ